MNNGLTETENSSIYAKFCAVFVILDYVENSVANQKLIFSKSTKSMLFIKEICLID